MSVELAIAIVGAVISALVAAVGALISNKVSGVDRKLDGVDVKVSQLGEHRAATDVRIANLEKGLNLATRKASRASHAARNLETVVNVLRGQLDRQNERKAKSNE